MSNLHRHALLILEYMEKIPLGVEVKFNIEVFVNKESDMKLVMNGLQPIADSGLMECSLKRINSHLVQVSCRRIRPQEYWITPQSQSQSLSRESSLRQESRVCEPNFRLSSDNSANKPVSIRDLRL